MVGNSRRRGQGAHIQDFLEGLLTHLGPKFYINISPGEQMQKIDDNWYMNSFEQLEILYALGRIGLLEAAL